MHLNNRHKLIVITHKKQKSFNVVVIRYKNNSTYVQKQINRLLKQFRRFARVYVNDIIIFFKTIKKHVQYLWFVFVILQHNNIFIKFNKVFLNYSFVVLLKQKINSFDFFINIEKLKTITKIQFFKTLRLLKTYLNFINYFRKYVFFYVNILKFLQIKKTKLLKLFLVADNARKFFANRIKIKNVTSLKKKVFRIFQLLLFVSTYFIHYN